MADLPSKEEIAEQMKHETGTGPNTYLPARQLAAWKKAVSIHVVNADEDTTHVLRDHGHDTVLCIHSTRHNT